MEANTTAATLDMRATPSQKNSSGVAWNWILEKLLDLSDAKKPLLKEIMSHAPDVKEAQSPKLLEKVAVRFLEEMIVTAPLDIAAVPLVEILTKQDNTQEGSSEEIYQTDLGLRVRIEAVLSTIRKISGDGKRDWSRFVSALDQVFPEKSEDARDISQRKELVAYLFPKNQKEVSVSKLLSKYPLKVLQQDILQLLEQKKARFQLSTLDQLAEWILSKAPVPSSTEVFPTDVDSPDTNWCSGHMSILNKRKTHEITRQEASECQEMSMASGKYKEKIKHSRLRTAQNRKEVEMQGEEVLTKDTKTETAPEEDATHKDGHEASEVEEENRKENAAKRRRVLLNVEVTSESEEDHTSRSARTDLTFWPGRKSMVATSPSRRKFIQGSSSQIQDVPRRNLGRHIHPDASVEKKGALHGVEFSNEDEDGGSRNVKPCLRRAVEKSNPQVCCNTHPGAVNLFLARNALGTCSITANSLHTHSLFRKSPVLTQGASGDLDIGIRLTEENDPKHVNSLEHIPSKALGVVRSAGDTERLCKQDRSKKKVFVQEAEVRGLAGTPSEQKTYTRLKDSTPALQLSSEENAQRSEDEWKSREKSLRQAALENCVAHSRLMQQTKTPSQEELEMVFNDLRPLRRHKRGIGVQEQENLEHDDSSRSDITVIIKHGEDTLFKSRNIDYQELIKSNKFDIKSGANETTPTVDGNTFDRLHLKDVQDMEKGATRFVSNLLAFFGGAYEEPKKDCHPKPAQDNLGGHGFFHVEYLEIGNDGHEERCHRCRQFGELLCCDGCPIAMHTSCLKPLGLMLKDAKENWYCPVCCERKAMKLVVEADKIAAEARANFEAFIQLTSKKRRQSEGGTHPHKKESNEHKRVTHGSGPIEMAYKGDSTSSKVRKQKPVAQGTCALTSEVKAGNISMLVRKASRPDRWRAIIDQSGSSSDEDLLDHKREEITAKNTGTSSSDVLIPVVRILDFEKYVNRPVSSIDRQDINTNKDGENTPQHAHGGGNPHLLEVFELKERNLSTRVGKLEEGHCKGVSGSKVVAERGGESPAEELPLNTPNPEDKDVEVEHVNKRGGPAPGEVEKDKDKNEGDLEEEGGKPLIGSIRNSMLGIPGVQRTPVPWTQDKDDELKEGVHLLSPNGHWIVHKTPVLMAYKADCTSSQLRNEATDVLETYVPKSEMATANVAIEPKASRPDQWRAIIHQSSSSSEEDLLDHKQQDIPADNTSTSSSDVQVSVLRAFDVGKYVNRPISSIDREGIKTNKDGENPCEERSFENNPQHTHRGGNAELLEVSEPKEANLSMSFGKLKEDQCQGVRATTERGDSPAGKSPLSNPNPEDEEVEIDHVNKGGRPAPGEVEEEKDKNEGDLEEAGGSTLIGSLKKNMLGGWYRIPGVLRRTPVPWTQDEEDALKEGVQRFSQDGQWGFQWTRILQYGVGRYHHSRTARDLRDKWRSMIKGCTY